MRVAIIDFKITGINNRDTLKKKFKSNSGSQMFDKLKK